MSRHRSAPAPAGRISSLPHAAVTAPVTIAARYDRWALLTLIALYLALALHYGAVLPVLEGPDEQWHYGYVKYLADGGGLPVLSLDRPDLQESHQPPLYYAAGALATFWIDTSDLPALMTPNPHWGAGGRTSEIDNKNLWVHGWPQESFPYAGAALAVHVVRALSALMGAGTLLCVYLLARELLGARPNAAAAALAATGFVAFNPQFLYLSGAVNNDNLVVLVSALGLWLVARVALGREWPAPWVVGVVIGLGLLSKWSAGALAPAALAALAWRCRGREVRYPWRALLRDSVMLALPVLVIAGWWYVRNQVLYGDPLALRMVVQIFETRDPVPTIPQAIAELPQYEPSFWGRFGWENVPAPAWFDLLVLILDRLALAGLAIGAVRRWALGRRDDATRRGEDGALLALGVFGVLLLALFIQWVRTTFPVGRHLFPGLPLAGLALAVGLAMLGALAGRPWLKAAVPLAALVPLALSAAVMPLGVIAPAYYPPPAPDASELAAMTPAGADVGGTLRLLGYRAQPLDVPPGGTVTLTLYWQAIAPADRDWTVFVHLSGPDGMPIAQRDTFPAFGRISTRFVEPDRVWSEQYVLQVPPLDAPVQAVLHAGLYDEHTGARAQAPDGDWVTLATVRLRGKTGPATLADSDRRGGAHDRVLDLFR